jgi:cold shock CspA family protein/tetratricopeptide (TPR) repeat protein
MSNRYEHQVALLSNYKRVNALIAAIETDSRNLVLDWVFPIDDQCLRPFLEEAIQRLPNDQEPLDFLGTENIDLLDFIRPIEVIIKYGKQIDSLKSDSIHLAKSQTFLAQIRNAGAHRHGTNRTDYEIGDLLNPLLQFSNELSDMWRITKFELANPGATGWENADIQPDIQNVLNNVPSPDWSATDLVGRRNELSEVLNLLKNDRYRSVEIVGSGGVGKTALAQKVAFQLIDDGGPFDCILWCSLKTTRFDIDGVSEIQGAITDLFPSIESLGIMFDQSFEGGIERLAEAIELIADNPLIIIDNYESATGATLAQLDAALPAKTKYLITSRISVRGERFDLSGITPEEGAKLLKRLGSTLEVPSLTNASFEELSVLATRYGEPTLSLVVLAQYLSRGRPISEFAQNMTNILEYCLAGIVNSLGANERLVLFSMLESNSSSSELSISAVTGLDVEARNDALQTLNKLNWITSRFDLETANQSYSVTPAVREYLSREDIFSAEDKAKIEAIRSDSERFELRRLESEQRNPLGWYSLSEPERVESNKAIAKAYLQFQADGRGPSPSAIELADSAINLAPEYAEAWLCKANVSVGFSYPERNIFFERAQYLANSEKQIARVANFEGYFLMSLEMFEKAVERFSLAMQYIHDESSLISTATALLRQGKYEESISILKVKSELFSPRKQLIASMVEARAYQNWSESIRELDPAQAFRLAVLGLKRILRLHSNGGGDADSQRRYFRLIDASCLALIESKRRNLVIDEIDDLSPLLRVDWLGDLPNKLWIRTGPVLIETAKHFEPVRKFIIESQAPLSATHRFQSRYMNGVIKRVPRDKDFAFIAHPNYPNNVYFHRSALRPRHFCELQNLFVGQQVWFSVLDTARGPQAIEVAPILLEELLPTNPE